MPFLVLTGEKASGDFLIDQGRLVAANVRGEVIKGSGHWLIDEAPQQVIPLIVTFINETPESAQKRLTVSEADAIERTRQTEGTSGVAGIQTSVLKGEPDQSGMYTILLTIPANTQIEAHSHPDDRVGTVISGTWYFGYGNQFDEQRLKALPPGSFYTEPPDHMHFARTGDTPVILQITGFGPTGTRYYEHGADPQTEPKGAPSSSRN
jgi:quercetin dioxygenase-like cupin family protein